MVVSTLSLPIVDFAPFLADPTSEEALAECKKAAESMHLYGALALRDPRASEEENNVFVDLMEDYFNQPFEDKLNDIRPEFGYQVGATPELTEEPRCGRDDNCLALVSKMSEEDKPLDFNGKDPKWRFFWRIGEVPETTKYTNLNATPVRPSAFPQWDEVMNSWGGKLHQAVSTFAEMLAVGFGLPADTIINLAKNGPHLLAPTGSDLTKFGTPGTVLAGFHTDLNCITIHGKSRYPGLFIWTRDGRKMQVKIPNGCLLVQAGKQLEWVTHGHVEAGYHEVVVTPSTLEAMERQKALGRPLWRISSTMFYHIASDNVLKPLSPQFENAEAGKKYPAIPTGDQVLAELGFIKLSA